jgi:hypothetical protein
VDGEVVSRLAFDCLALGIEELGLEGDLQSYRHGKNLQGWRNPILLTLSRGGKGLARLRRVRVIKFVGR